MIIAPIAGCSAGTSGNSRIISGRIRRAITVSSPPRSATFIKPRNRAITPTRPIARVTESRADSIMPAPRACIGDTASGSAAIQCSWFQAVIAKARLISPKKTAFNAAIPWRRRGRRH